MVCSVIELGIFGMLGKGISDVNRRITEAFDLLKKIVHGAVLIIEFSEIGQLLLQNVTGVWRQQEKSIQFFVMSFEPVSYTHLLMTS